MAWMQCLGGQHYSTRLSISTDRVIGASMSEPPDDEAHGSSRATPPDTPCSSKDVQQRHREVIRLLELHTPLREIASITGYSLRTIQYIGQRYRETGLVALEDRRARGQGAPPLLTPPLQCELGHALQVPPPDGGTWTGSKVAQWMTARTGKPIARQRGWEYLGRLRGSITADSESFDDRKE
jgi:transposase